ESIRAPYTPSDRPQFDHDFSVLREALGDAGFDLAWADGLTMTMDQAVAYALKIDLPPLPPLPQGKGEGQPPDSRVTDSTLRRANQERSGAPTATPSASTSPPLPLRDGGQVVRLTAR